MRVLLLYPSFLNRSSFDKALELIGRKVSLPSGHDHSRGYPTPDLGVPLGGSCSVGDRSSWAGGQIWIISGMIVQKPDMLHP